MIVRGRRTKAITTQAATLLHLIECEQMEAFEIFNLEGDDKEEPEKIKAF